jgi:orotidine-5'-phosphate decarboxylase
MHFAARLSARIAATDSVACVGLDPVLEHLPAEVRARHHEPLSAIAEFCHGVIRAAGPHVAAIKFQSACYERYGAKGVALLEECIADAAGAGLVVVLDVKRGDIGISANHYAASAQRAGAHAVTLSGYMGPSTITPFLQAGLGVFVLVRTSNPDSDAIQSLALADGRTVAQAMADVVHGLARDERAAWHAEDRARTSISNVGAVVGATKATDAAALRARMPDSCFLVPGYGAQGGTAQDIRAMLRAGRTGSHDAGVLVTASRSVIYAQKSDAPWGECIRAAAIQLTSELRGVLSVPA